MKEEIYYVYFHLKPDTQEIFYVGKGKGNRMHSNQRSKFWKRVVLKYKGFDVKVIKENLLESEASLLEMFFIKFYGRRDIKTGILVNMTDGGEGSPGRKASLETKKRMSENRGKLNYTNATKAPAKVYIKKHPNGYTPTEETRNKIRETLKKYKPSELTKQLQSNSLKGKPKEVIICPHCTKSGGSSAMKRWHFDKCKKNNERNE